MLKTASICEVVPEMYGIIKTENRFGIVMEFCKGERLDYLMSSNPPKKLVHKLANQI